VRRLVLAAGIAALAAGLPASAHASEPATLAEAGGTHFPDRAYALTLPRAATVTASNVEVRENGRVVEDVTVSPAEGARAYRFGVVLTIDTSSSMRGAPLRGAIEAARAFVAHRSPAQPVALVTFGGKVDVTLPFTTDPRAIEAALDSVEVTGGGSRILDATLRSVELIKTSRIASGSVVVLSDGADRGSLTPAGSVAERARTAGARVFGVGLSSRSRDFGSLNLLAAGTQGEFSEASSLTDLARVFERLGSRLGHQYIVEYHSAARPGRRVRVELRVDGVPGIARASYATPAVARGHRPPFHRPPADVLWRSPAFALVLSILVGGLLMGGAWALIRPRGTSLRDRMASYVAEPEEDPGQRGPLLAGRLRLGAERSFEQLGWAMAFKEKLDVAQIAIPAERLLGWTTLGTIACLVLLSLLGSPALGLLALGVPLGTYLAVERRVRKQRDLFTEQLPDTLQIIASAMRAGHSFAAALTVVIEDAPEPTRGELRRVVADERLGVPLDTALGVIVRRMESKEFEQVALVAALQRETGGNTAEVLERVTDTVRDRLALRRMVSTLTAQGRLSRWVLTAIPIVLLLLMTAINPGYVAPLYTTGVGQAFLVFAGCMVVAGSLVIKKIVNIKV
jgi:tight adherence protein B